MKVFALFDCYPDGDSYFKADLLALFGTREAAQAAYGVPAGTACPK